MRIPSFIVLLFACFSINAAENEKVTLDGTWRLVSASGGMSDIFEKRSLLVFRDGMLRFTYNYGAGSEKGEKIIELSFENGLNKITLVQPHTAKGWHRAGVFKIEGNTLTLSLGSLENPATDFEVRKDGPAIFRLIRVDVTSPGITPAK